jgi:hypothetical protein
MSNKFALLFLFLLSGCATTYHGHPGYCEAGMPLNLVYQTPEEMLSTDSKNGNEREIEMALLPKGGRLVLTTKRNVYQSMNYNGVVATPGASYDASNPELDIGYVNINIDGHFYCECESLIEDKQSNWSASLFGGSNKRLVQMCDINKEVKKTFDVLILNFEKEPLAKYSVRMDY